MIYFLILNTLDYIKYWVDNMSKMYEEFHKNFEIVIADTPELLRVVFHVRYQALCVEKRLPGFDMSLYPDQLEKDQYDHHSSHALLRYRETGDFIGTVRLIRCDPMNSGKPFPVELHTLIDPALCNIDELSRQHTVEISRLIVLNNFDRRKSERRNVETRSMDSSTSETDRRYLPNLTLLLVAAAVRMSNQGNVRNWLSVMEPALNRLLGYYGSGLTPIGPKVNYLGLRRPYFSNYVDMLDKMYLTHRDAWEIVTEKGMYCRSPTTTIFVEERV